MLQWLCFTLGLDASVDGGFDRAATLRDTMPFRTPSLSALWMVV